MELFWQILKAGFLKVNVHWVQAHGPNTQNNNNRVGLILRNNEGTKLWGAMGPLKAMDEMQACL